MAKGIYIGIDNIARKVKKIYIGKNEELEVVDYIESSGTQYIDTEITASQDIKVEMNFENLETSKSTHMFGSRITAGDDSINISYMNESWGNGWSFAWGDETQQTTDVTTSNRSYILGDNKAYINDTLMHTFTTQTFTNSYNMFLFTCNNGGVPHTQYSSIRLRYCKIWDNNILVRDLIPVKRQNGEYCLYDKVTQKLFLNKGISKFNGGIATNEVINFNDKARKVIKGYVGVKETYKVLDYIESSGTQYIDTKYVPNSNTKWVLDAELNYPTGTYSATGRYGNSQRLQINVKSGITEPAIGDATLQPKDYESGGIRRIYTLDVPNLTATVSGIDEIWNYTSSSWSNTDSMFLFTSLKSVTALA